MESPAPADIALVTGTLAAPALRGIAAELEQAGRLHPHIIVLPIQVAALMTVEWVARKIVLPPLPEGKRLQRVILPGHCRGDLGALTAQLAVPVERGPLDVYDLPELFDAQARRRADYGRYDLEIIAEINHAAHLPPPQILAMAEAYRRDGADVIDIGCDPQSDRDPWTGIAEVVRTLRERGLRVSVDSFQPREVELAVGSGAELVLSVNSGNVDRAADWGAAVVAIPDTPSDLDSLERTVARLERDGVPYRLDPIVEPIGFGFAHSLGRYLEVRRRHPQAAMMMGVGNLTEMTEVDSAGINALLIGFCQELGIASVLTTQVINWARSSVREIDVARRLMFHAVSRRSTPKHLDARLVQLRDPKLRPLLREDVAGLAANLTDRNIRLFAIADAEGGTLHALNKDFHFESRDPFELYDRLLAAGINEPDHAFYVGYELAKAVTALTLGKNYVQDRALGWGALTREEQSHQARRKRKKNRPPPAE